MRIKKAVFPVAGLGTRFLPATKAFPKEMLPVAGKPLIQYAVEEALNSGIELLIFVTSREKHAIEDYFCHFYELEHSLFEKEKYDILRSLDSLVPESGTIVYTRQDKPLGLGHAVWCTRNIVGNEPFAIFLVDDLIKSEKPVLLKMIEAYERLNSSIVAVMSIDKKDSDKYGIIDAGSVTDKAIRIKGFVEKPKPAEASSNMAIVGRYILTPEIFDILGEKRKGAEGEIQLTDAMEILLKDNPVYGFSFDGTRFDCGTKTGFQMANIAFSMDIPKIREKLVPFMKSLFKGL